MQETSIECERNIIQLIITIKIKIMTKQKSNYPLVELSKQQVENLIKDEKEIVAVDFFNGNNKIFGTVDLWNIQRQRKIRIPKRSLNTYEL